MAGTQKKALVGLSMFQFFPVIQDDLAGYAAAEDAISVPWVAQMDVSDDTSENKFYGDDNVYLDMVSWNGKKLTITFHEFSLENYADFGFGSYDKTTGTLAYEPQSSNKEYAVTFRQMRADGSYMMTKAYNFVVSQIQETGAQTRSDAKNLNDVKVIGTIGRRRIDNAVMDVRDTAAPPEAGDLAWLDEVESVTR